MKLKVNVLVYTILLTLFLGHPAYAQGPYNHSIGGVIGNLNGASFKMFFSDKVALQADFGFKFGNSYRYKYTYGYNYYTLSQMIFFTSLELNPNVLYQGDITQWDFANFYWFAGGGASIGCALNPTAFKFGLNAMGGVELTFRDMPLTVQADLRPGIGFVTRKGADPFFDYAFTLSARYVID
ncbi:hypothetical protein LJC68_02600 [Bacteroidales bacterium OttesenSCG-928-B11]|nr:hypothetical protein [Bacteroidales bacterium OttesenSCG-928-B11]MDL2325458.1 hypothetical protein [Bacteroidales bacterium OttesenSCG-928-A14]